MEVENNKVARALNVASAADVRLEIKPMILFSLFNLVFIVMHLSKVSMVKCSNGWSIVLTMQWIINPIQIDKFRPMKNYDRSVFWIYSVLKDSKRIGSKTKKLDSYFFFFLHSYQLFYDLVLNNCVSIIPMKSCNNFSFIMFLNLNK